MEEVLAKLQPDTEERTRKHMNRLGCQVKTFSMDMDGELFVVCLEIVPGKTGLNEKLCFKHRDPGELIETIELLGKSPQAQA